ncbi:hypothetical protein BDV95DRAFT_497230 [Massariosphaeria phaeospora]|uniref:Pyrroloquinoline quinone-dependent pyranose dehydrogenase beta-propeller domain-containing protein n=1 Tax=Massariosphaeria phaeospora TaxID=100035 RepID=A0A7C8I3A6_9PLEO|nr:hypothetical protein BDV95DRAFT_497230 [Massariosphaeria phaeospora]
MAAAASLNLIIAIIICCIGRGTRAQSAAAPCASTLAPKNAAPSVAPGWSAQVVASGLQKPRGMVFDTRGHLLVVQQGVGIARVRLSAEKGACVRAEGEVADVVADERLNHGVELAADGRTLYASSAGAVYAWDYDADEGRNSSGPREVVNGMGDPEDGHVTRTLLMSRRVEGMLLVSRGSMANLDPAAQDISTGVSTIKAFNVSNVTDSPYRYTEDGVLLGWGLRNSVGIAEEPVTGGIYSVENSVDNFEREGVNIHQNNPGEEMNFHGYLNGTETAEQGGNYGYPSCYAAWDVGEIPQSENVQVGTQFAIGDQNATVNDTFCRDGHVAPRLTFAAHMAPLDMKFNGNGTAANRDSPIGYKLSVIPFDGAGSPTAASTSNTAALDIVSNADLSRCPDSCFRPAGLAWDGQGRLFMSSDTTGEIYVVVREDGGSANEAGPSSGLPSPPSSTGAAPSGPSGAAVGKGEVVDVARFAAVWAGIMALPLL